MLAPSNGVCESLKNETPGPQKKDTTKPPVDLVPKALIFGAARAYGFGVQKYAAFNFRLPPGLKTRRLAAAALRHILEWLDGTEADEESGLCTLDHAAAELGMLMDTLERVRRGELPAETDDHYRRPEPQKHTEK